MPARSLEEPDPCLRPGPLGAAQGCLAPSSCGRGHGSPLSGPCSGPPAPRIAPPGPGSDRSGRQPRRTPARPPTPPGESLLPQPTRDLPFLSSVRPEFGLGPRRDLGGRASGRPHLPPALLTPPPPVLHLPPPPPFLQAGAGGGVPGHGGPCKAGLGPSDAVRVPEAPLPRGLRGEQGLGLQDHRAGGWGCGARPEGGRTGRRQGLREEGQEPRGHAGGAGLGPVHGVRGPQRRRGAAAPTLRLRQRVRCGSQGRWAPRSASLLSGGPPGSCLAGWGELFLPLPHSQPRPSGGPRGRESPPLTPAPCTNVETSASPPGSCLPPAEWGRRAIRAPVTTLMSPVSPRGADVQGPRRGPCRPSIGQMIQKLQPQHPHPPPSHLPPLGLQWTRRARL